MKKVLFLTLLAAITVSAFSGMLRFDEAGTAAAASLPREARLSENKAAGTEPAFESFTDANFTADPAWTGNTSAFTVAANSDTAAGATASNTLRLNAPATVGIEYLTSQISDWRVSQEWRFWMGRRSQALTAANQQFVWLYANEGDLNSSTVRGYRISIGDDTGGDEIRLQYVNGASVTTVITSTGSVPNGLTDIGFQVRVRRSSTGSWDLHTSVLPTANGNGAVASDIPSATNTPIFQGSGSSTAVVPSANGYLGVAALHSTGGNAIVAAEWDQFYVSFSDVPTIPLSTNQFVSAAIGQQDLAGVNPATSDSRMRGPWDVDIDQQNGKVYVADTLNNRVLRFASATTFTSGGQAEAVFGQSQFTTMVLGTGTTGMSGPTSVAIAPDGTLWVSDTGNNRVLYFNNAATATNGIAYSGRLTSTGPTFSNPHGLDVDPSGRLWVADRDNNRVLRFNDPKAGVTIAPSASACISGGISATTCERPYDVHVDANDNVWVADGEYDRVLRFENSSTHTTGTPARGVLGQPSFVVTNPALNSNQIDNPRSIVTDPYGNLYVSDADNHRVMVFSDAADLPNGANAVAVLGQANFTSSSVTATNRGAQPPSGLAFDNISGDLLTADPSRNRVIRYDGLAPAVPPTQVSTGLPMNVTPTAGTMQGNANPNGSATVGYFRVATTYSETCSDSYGVRTPTTGGTDLGSGTSVMNFTHDLSSITPGTTIYYCAVAENAGGRAFGEVYWFTTNAPPTVTTEPATNVTSTAARLNATVDANGLDSVGHFRISETDGVCSPTFGSRAPASGEINIGNSITPTPFSYDIAGSLAPSTEYFYCAVGQNSEGTSYASTTSSFTTAAPRTLYVDNTEDSGAFNTCDPFQPNDCSLRGAVSIAENGETIMFEQPSTVKGAAAGGPTTIYLFTQIVTDKSISIIGTGAANLTVRGLGNFDSSRLFSINGGASVSISNMRLSNGRGNGGGAGGGAFYVDQSTLSLNNVELADNGVIAGHGGAIYINNGTLNISNSTVASSTSNNNGGAINSENSSVNIANSTISGNTSAQSGVLFQSGGTLNILSSTISLNTSNSPNSGGGLIALFANVTVQNSIISGNHSPGTYRELRIQSSTFTSGGNNMIGDAVGDSNVGQAVTWQPTDIREVPHRLGPLQLNGGQTRTHLPAFNYPGLDKGCSSLPMFPDQRGSQRVVDHASVANAGCTNPTFSEGADIGAVELQTIPEIYTTAATDILRTTATLNGIGTPNGVAMTGYFRYSSTNGTCSDTFGTRAPTFDGVELGSNSAPISFSVGVAGLTANTTYYYCAIAETASGTVYGAVQEFTTPVNAVIIVDTSDDDAGMNQCTSAGGDCSLRGAIAIAADGDTIQFESPATLKEIAAPAATINLASAISINADITINGTGPQNLTINGGGIPSGERVFRITNTADVTINNLRISNGGGNGTDVPNFGGALLVEGGALSLNNVEVTDSYASNGGGAVAVLLGGTLNVTRSLIFSNFAGEGAAIHSSTGTVNISNSTISNNIGLPPVEAGGGAIFAGGGTLTVSNSTITGNRANTSVRAGGVTSNANATTITSSIISGNSGNAYPELYVMNGSITSGGFNMFGNDAGDSANTGIAMVYQSTDILDAPNTLGPLDNNGGPTRTHMPTAGFPGLDKGCAFGLSSDQRGQARINDWTGIADAPCAAEADRGADIGAVEMLAPTAAEVSLSGRVISLNGQGIRGAAITIQGGGLESPRIVTTNTFGHYCLEGLAAGQTYIITVRASKHTFAESTRVVNLYDNLAGVDFVSSR